MVNYAPRLRQRERTLDLLKAFDVQTLMENVAEGSDEDLDTSQEEGRSVF